MKYIILGAGGTGGILGFYMTKAGKDVTLIARNAHLEVMKKQGLSVEKMWTNETETIPVSAESRESYEEKGEKVVEKRYYISSLLIDTYNFSKAIRNHWNVENKMHWQLDFTFKTDDNTTVNKKALFNLQIIKKFALNILNQVKEDYKGCAKRLLNYF